MIARLVRHATLALAVVGLAACNTQDRPEPKKQDDFELVLAVAPQSDNRLGRVVLPAAAIAELKRADLGDVRIFDAKGRTLSLAQAYDRSGDSSLLKTHDLPAIPIVTGPDGSERPLSVEVRTGDATVTVSASGDAADAVAPRSMVFIDTRTLGLPVVGIELAAILPRQRPVTFTLETSSDLKTWQPLAEKVLLRPGNDPEVLGQARISLPAVDLRDRYVRVSWDTNPDVTVSGAKVLEAVERQPARVELETSGAKLSNPHELRFAPQISVPIAAVKLELAGTDGIVPVELFGRNDRSEPWGLLARGTLKQGEGPVSLELSGSTTREYRLVADRRSSGFSKEPRISLAVDPVTVFAAFNGEGPFNLAVGHDDAKPAWFDEADLGKPSDLLRAWRRPAEVASAGEAPVILLAPAAPETPFDPRTMLLWGALLLGAAVLAVAAWRLIKASNSATVSSDDSNAL
ncbi:MAG: DUF3999 family protein [Sphingomonadales bacterium]|nr:DUF3999 family protein [Sphingomonadales bacterium]